jgi:hypothetical protein
MDDVQYVGDPAAANKNQTHFMVACYCDDVKQCGINFVLFSDLTFLPACSSAGVAGVDTTLNTDSQDQCSIYCTELFGFAAGTYDSTTKSCVCDDGAGTSATACDDSTANSDRGQFDDCFSQVGVSTADCPTPTPTLEGGSSASTTGGRSATLAVTILSMGMTVVVALGAWHLL